MARAALVQVPRRGRLGVGERIRFLGDLLQLPLPQTMVPQTPSPSETTFPGTVAPGGHRTRKLTGRAQKEAAARRPLLGNSQSGMFQRMAPTHGLHTAPTTENRCATEAS